MPLQECNAAIHKKCIDKIIGRCTGTAANSRDTIVSLGLGQGWDRGLSHMGEIYTLSLPSGDSLPSLPIFLSLSLPLPVELSWDVVPRVGGVLGAEEGAGAGT